MNLFAELKRRNVYRAAVFYAASAWLLVQVATQVFPFFHIAEWVVRWIVVAAIVGFPFVLAFAWFYEFTPEGLKRESEVDPSQSIMHATGKKLDRWIIATLSLAVVLLLTDKFVLRKDGSALSEKSIAVLPLVNESGDPNNEYFSDGLSEELIAALARIDGLKVIGRSSSFRFKGKGADTRAIGVALGVATLIEGTVRKQADRVRIVAALINAEDGRQLWSQTYDRELKDIFAVQSELAQAVTDSLEVKLLGGKSSQQTTTTNVVAHNAYLQGHAYFERRNVDAWRKAIAFFDEAIRLDPGYALAYAERGESYSWLADQTGEDVVARRATARRDAEKAVALDPNLAEAHTALGWVHFFDDWNFPDALTELRLAERLAPGSAKIKGILAQLLDTLGQTQEAHALAMQAIELDPLYYYAHSMLTRNLLAQGHFDAAEAEARKSADLQPGAARSHVNQVVVAVLRGDGDAALREAQLEPADAYSRFALALAYFARGDRAAADAALAQMVAIDNTAAAFQIAQVYAFRGETDSAFQWLQHGYDIRDTGLLSISTDPLLRGLHSDPRFTLLLGKMGLSTPAKQQ
jgi:serine/threonine-protein kinase